jgi:hypothetical protein
MCEVLIPVIAVSATNTAAARCCATDEGGVPPILHWRMLTCRLPAAERLCQQTARTPVPPTCSVLHRQPLVPAALLGPDHSCPAGLVGPCEGNTHQQVIRL